MDNCGVVILGLGIDSKSITKSGTSNPLSWSHRTSLPGELRLAPLHTHRALAGTCFYYYYEALQVGTLQSSAGHAGTGEVASRGK